MSTKTIHATLYEDLHLSKKKAQWFPKLLNLEIKNEKVRICKAFLALVYRHSMATLDWIVTMDKSAVSFHTFQTKQQSKQWLEKGTPRPIKVKVHVYRIKQMVLAIFDSKGLIYTSYVPSSNMVNANYIVDALGKFLKIFKQKRLDMAARDWQFQVIKHPPYSPDLAPADFLFPKVKRKLAGLTLTKETFKEWEGATKTLKAADFAMAFYNWIFYCGFLSINPSLGEGGVT